MNIRTKYPIGKEGHGLNENTLLSMEKNLSSDRNIKKNLEKGQCNFLSRPHFWGLGRERANKHFFLFLALLSEPSHGKIGLRGFRPGLTQTKLYSRRSRLEA